MRTLLVGLVFVWFAALGPACSGTCKNPKRGPVDGVSGTPEGILVQCNVVILCKGGSEIRFDGMADPQIIDTGSHFQNQIKCEKAGEDKNPQKICDGIQVSPQIICLDPPGSGCNAGTGTGSSTVIIVGAAASGDYRSDPSGDGGASGYSGGGDGAGGQGGF